MHTVLTPGAVGDFDTLRHRTSTHPDGARRLGMLLERYLAALASGSGAGESLADSPFRFIPIRFGPLRLRLIYRADAARILVLGLVEAQRDR